MKLTSTILLSLAAAMVVIGAHLTMTAGIMASYPFFMFAVLLLFWHMYRRNQSEAESREREKGGKRKNKKSNG
jgi:type III secretory pathway component EscV